MIDPAAASFIGPYADDLHILEMLPGDYRELLSSSNACILFGGGLHIRGACSGPDWHSLRQVWVGADSLARLYPAVQSSDVPFAQDSLGDQFLLRDASVYRLDGETGELSDTQRDWQSFLISAQADPVNFLSLNRLLQYESDGVALKPGQLLSTYLPLCTKEASSQIAALPDGTTIRVSIK
jgi:hypothetical protein